MYIQNDNISIYLYNGTEGGRHALKTTFQQEHFVKVLKTKVIKNLMILVSHMYLALAL